MSLKQWKPHADTCPHCRKLRTERNLHLFCWIVGGLVFVFGVYLEFHGYQTAGYAAHDIGLAPIVASIWRTIGMEV